MSAITAALTLFFIMDPLGNVPLFVSVLAKSSPERRRIIIIRELCIALGVLLFFLFFGQMLLNYLNIQQPTLTIAGGIILFLIAIKMIFPPAKADGFAEPLEGEPLIVPLAVPLVAGPSSMSFVMIIASQHPDRVVTWVGAIAIAWLVNAAILMNSFRLYDVCGPKFMTAVTRLMGMLLSIMSVQMFMDGITKFVKG
ncbi:MAG: MarC family protein [Elusimicrobiaceae bacterium]